MKSATVQKEPTPRQLSRYELDEIESQRERIQFRLEGNEEQLDKRRNALAEVEQRIQQAKQLLAIEATVPGYESERQRAEEVLLYCEERKRELQLQVDNTERLIAELKGQLQKLPSAASARKKTIDELVARCRAPLP